MCFDVPASWLRLSVQHAYCDRKEVEVKVKEEVEKEEGKGRGGKGRELNEECMRIKKDVKRIRKRVEIG